MSVATLKTASLSMAKVVLGVVVAMKSTFKSWPRFLCCVLGQETLSTLLSQCPAPPGVKTSTRGGEKGGTISPSHLML